MLDVLLHGQDDVAARARRARRGADPRRHPRRRRAQARARRAPTRWCTWPRSSATPPARATPSCPTTVNVEGSRALVARRPRAAGVERLLFASTCSNYGRMADPTVPIDETRRAAPGVALRRAEGRRSRRRCSSGERQRPRCARPACASPPSTASGDRMRFDLTVNEFTRDLWADRKLEVFGERFWRPYIHVRDAARAVRARAGVAGREGRRRASSTPATRTRTTASSTWSRSSPGSSAAATWSTCTRDEDPRDYKVSFEKIQRRARLRAAPPRSRRHRGDRRRARGGALRRPVRRAATRTSADEPTHRADPAVRRAARADREIDAVADTLRSGWLTMGPRTQEFEAGLRRAPRRASTRSRCPAAPPRSTSPTWPPAWAPATR